MKRMALFVVVLMGVLSLTGATASAQGVVQGSQNIGIVTMNAQNGSGESGSAVLSEENGKLTVTLELANGTSQPQPAHIHRGTCANLDPVPAYPLSSVVNGKSTTTLDITLATVMSGEYAINVHKSAAEATTYVSCGDLTQMARAGGINGGTGGGVTSMPSTGGGNEILLLSVLGMVALVFVGVGAAVVRRSR